MSIKKSRILFNDRPITVNVTLAEAIGLNEAIVLQQVSYWLGNNELRKQNFIDGRYWTYNTIANWQENFPFWSYSTVKRILKKLRDLGILIAKNYNKMKSDNTLWYTIDYGKLDQITDELENLKNKKKEEIEKIEKPLEALKSYDGSKWPSGSKRCKHSLGHIDPVDWVNMTQPLPETYTEINNEEKNQVNLSISNPSVSHSSNKEKEKKEEDEKIKEDRPTDRDKEISRGELRTLKAILENCCLDSIDEEYREASRKAITSLFLEACSSSNTKMGNLKIPSQIIKEDLGSLDFFVVEHGVNKFKEVATYTEVRNPIGYLRSCIYNSIGEMSIDIDSELRGVGLIT